MFEYLRVPVYLKALMNSCLEVPVGFSNATCLTARAFK